VFYSVLGSLSGRCLLTSAAHATSFDCVNTPRVSPVDHTARPIPRIRFPTANNRTARTAGTV